MTKKLDFLFFGKKVSVNYLSTLVVNFLLKFNDYDVCRLCAEGVRVERLCFLFPYMRYSDQQAWYPVPARDEPSKWPQLCFLKLF